MMCLSSNVKIGEGSISNGFACDALPQPFTAAAMQVCTPACAAMRAPSQHQFVIPAFLMICRCACVVTWVFSQHQTFISALLLVCTPAIVKIRIEKWDASESQPVNRARVQVCTFARYGDVEIGGRGRKTIVSSDAYSYRERRYGFPGRIELQNRVFFISAMMQVCTPAKTNA